MAFAETKNCQNCKKDFTVEPDDFAFYEKMQVPPPTWCPECRMQRRMAFTNDRALYKRNCDLCSKSVVSQHPQSAPIIVYCNSCWWGDKWDEMQFGQEYDSSRPFLIQLGELIRKTPHVALDSNYPTLINSPYVNHCATAKNCYLIFTADECQNVFYSEYLLHDKDLMDCTMTGSSELCYGLINSGSCYRTFFSEDCENCREVYFSKDCVGCSDCFGCFGLRNQSYYIFNEPYSKEEYQKKIKEFRLDSYASIENLKSQARSFWQRYPHKFSHSLRNSNVTGEYVYSSKNSKNMYVVHEGAEDSRYCQIITMSPIKDCYDYSIWGNGAQRIYESMITGEGADTVKFSFQAWPNVREIEYSFFAISSSSLFGCANIRKKQYCILNKQYTKEEYERLRVRIIEDMNQNPYLDKKGRVYKYGEFFPPELSLCGYNESYAAELFPLTKKEAVSQGFNWRETEVGLYKPTLFPHQIPDSIFAVPDSITGEILECLGCKAVFRIVQNELALLRRFEFPIPRECPNCRYHERSSRINPSKLWHRSCMKPGCANEFETTYAPNRPEILYCESCYNAEVV